MENQVISEQSSVANLILVGLIALVIGVVLVGGYFWQQSDPYAQGVLALQGDRDRGEAIFNINCIDCHGLGGDGGVGPSLHGVSNHRSQRSLIQQVTSGQTPPMPKFQPNSQEMADLLRYLTQL